MVASNCKLGYIESVNGNAMLLSNPCSKGLHVSLQSFSVWALDQLYGNSQGMGEMQLLT